MQGPKAKAPALAEVPRKAKAPAPNLPNAQDGKAPPPALPKEQGGKAPALRPEDAGRRDRANDGTTPAGMPAPPQGGTGTGA